MFVNAIEQASMYTRPVFTIARRYGSAEVMPGAATIFFVNEEGWAVTSKHVAKMIVDAGNIEKKYTEFRKNRNEIPGGYNFEEKLKALEEINRYSTDKICQLKVNFVDCVDRISGVECKMHPKYDVALIHFSGYEKLGYSGYATFASSSEAVKPGRFLCRLGYPFPEFRNFRYDAEKDDIVWTAEKLRSPRFPAEGMVTRLIGEQDGEIIGIELSTPGHKGAAGGPLFDPRGLVYGMQIGVNPLNLGQCVHMDIIKGMLTKEGIKYYEDQYGAKTSGDKSLIRMGPAAGVGNGGKMN